MGKPQAIDHPKPRMHVERVDDPEIRERSLEQPVPGEELRERMHPRQDHAGPDPLEAVDAAD